MVAIMSSFITSFVFKTNTKVFAKSVNFGTLSNVEVAWNIVPTADSNGDNQVAVVNCPRGKIALGGGGTGDGNMSQNGPLGVDISSGNSGTILTGATGWQIAFSNSGNPLISSSTVYVICATVNQ